MLHRAALREKERRTPQHVVVYVVYVDYYNEPSFRLVILRKIRQTLACDTAVDAQIETLHPDESPDFSGNKSLAYDTGPMIVEPHDLEAGVQSISLAEMALCLTVARGDSSEVTL